MRSDPHPSPLPQSGRGRGSKTCSFWGGNVPSSIPGGSGSLTLVTLRFGLEDACPALVALRRRRNLCCKNLAKTRDGWSGNLELVTAPFSRFFITNTLHHRLLAYVLFVSCRGGVRWGSCGALRCFTRSGSAFSGSVTATKKIAVPAIDYSISTSLMSRRGAADSAVARQGDATTTVMI